MHTCQRCSKQLASPQSLWNHKQRCEKYDPPADLHEVCIGEKRKADGKYISSSDNRFPSMVKPSSAKRQRMKGDIVGYSDDGDVGKAILDRIVNSPRQPLPSHAISKVPVIPSGVVEKELDSTTSKGKGLWMSRGRGIDEDKDDGKDRDVDVDVSKTTERRKR